MGQWGVLPVSGNRPKSKKRSRYHYRYLVGPGRVAGEGDGVPELGPDALGSELVGEAARCFGPLAMRLVP